MKLNKGNFLIDVLYRWMSGFHLAEGTVLVVGVCDADKLLCLIFAAGAQLMLPLSCKVTALPKLKT